MYEKTWSLRRWWRLDVATPVRDRFWGDCRKREVKQKWYAVMRGLVMEVAVLTSYFAVVTCHTGLCSVYTCPGWQRITARTTNLCDMRRPINRISCSHVCVEYWVYGIAVLLSLFGLPNSGLRLHSSRHKTPPTWRKAFTNFLTKYTCNVFSVAGRCASYLWIRWI